jgi:hypothetical protein
MKTQYTAGPWHVGMKPGPMIYGHCGEQVCDMRNTILEKDEEKANLKLISASPDLAECVKEFLLCGPNAGHNQELIEQCKAALSKADIEIGES